MIDKRYEDDVLAMTSLLYAKFEKKTFTSQPHEMNEPTPTPNMIYGNPCRNKGSREKFIAPLH